jgi:hypothetical protein
VKETQCKRQKDRTAARQNKNIWHVSCQEKLHKSGKASALRKSSARCRERLETLSSKCARAFGGVSFRLVLCALRLSPTSLRGLVSCVLITVVLETETKVAGPLDIGPLLA